MKRITAILCICRLPVTAHDSQKVSQKMLFENSIVRVVELSNNNKPLHYDRYPSLFITVDSIKPAKWTFTWETSGSVRTPPSKLATLRVELKKSPSPKDIPSWPESLDAVHAAPNSHRVLFENASVRVLEVRVPPGTKEPFHVHPWPSIFIYLDSGGPVGAQRYYNKDGKITHDHPRIGRPPINPPEWRIHWMEPEPLHSIENMETAESSRTLPYRLPTLRVEFKGADSQGPAK